MPIDIAALTTPHRYRDSVSWALTPSGIAIEGAAPEGTPGQPMTVRRIWGDYGAIIIRWCEQLEIPVELVLATIAVESGGRPAVPRQEPGFLSDTRTPDRVSVGLMQTLISTATAMLGRFVTRDELKDPATSIEAGTRYIAYLAPKTGLDPVYAAAAYNAGSIHPEADAGNRWRLRCYRGVGGRYYIDDMLLWLNDAFRMFEIDGGAPPVSYARMLAAPQDDGEASSAEPST